MRQVYLDHSATTPVAPEVLEAMLPYFREHFGNPSSVHSFAQEPRAAIELARESVAALLGCLPEEICFTGGGTESDNLAVKGVVLTSKHAKPHVITSALEHNAVLASCRYLEKRGLVEVTYLPVDCNGLVSPADLKQALRPETAIVSIMHANNEVGVVQPLAELTAVAREAKVLFHTDAVQSVGKVATKVKDLGVDLLSLSAHKIYGPKGVGALYVRKGVKLIPIMHGGHHEHGRRAGTENVAGIVGLGRAAELGAARMESEAVRLDALRTLLWQGISAAIPDVTLNGHATSRLPHLASISFAGIEGEGMLLSLDMMGVAASTGSACTSDTLEPSHVLTAMGIEHALAQGTLRFSLGSSTTEDDIRYVVGILPDIVTRLRRMSPLV